MSKAELMRLVQRKVLRGGTKSAEDNMALFAVQVRKAKLRYRGTSPAKFALGSESFTKFRERFKSYALTSGWDPRQQVAAMLRFLDGEAANAFNRWIEEGRFAKMDAKIMWRLLQRHFCDPSEERQIARREITNRVQRKDENIMAYEQVFVEIANRADLSQEERVAQWTKNITPHIADACLVFVAQQDRTFEEVAKYARRLDRVTPDLHTPQVAFRRAVHVVSSKTSEVHEGDNSSEHPQAPAFSILAVREALKKEIVNELASKHQDVAESMGALKRKVDSIHVMQLQQEAKADSRTPNNRGPPSNRGRGRGNRYTDRRERTSPQPRVTLPDGICPKCGSKDHAICRWDENCNYCKRKGHKEEVCFMKMRDTPRTETK